MTNHNSPSVQEPRNSLLTVRRAAAMLALTESCLRAWITERRIGFVRLGRAIRIPLEEVRKLVTSGFVPPRRNTRGR